MTLSVREMIFVRTSSAVKSSSTLTAADSHSLARCLSRNPGIKNHGLSDKRHHNRTKRSAHEKRAQKSSQNPCPASPPTPQPQPQNALQKYSEDLFAKIGLRVHKEVPMGSWVCMLVCSGTLLHSWLFFPRAPSLLNGPRALGVLSTFFCFSTASGLLLINTCVRTFSLRIVTGYLREERNNATEIIKLNTRVAKN